MSVSKIRRNIKNVAYNFSPAQIKTREATRWVKYFDGIA